MTSFYKSITLQKPYILKSYISYTFTNIYNYTNVFPIKTFDEDCMIAEILKSDNILYFLSCVRVRIHRIKKPEHASSIFIKNIFIPNSEQV